MRRCDAAGRRLPTLPRSFPASTSSPWMVHPQPAADAIAQRGLAMAGTGAIGGGFARRIAQQGAIIPPARRVLRLAFDAGRIRGATRFQCMRVMLFML